MYLFAPVIHNSTKQKIYVSLDDIEKVSFDDVSRRDLMSEYKEINPFTDKEIDEDGAQDRDKWIHLLLSNR